jgi:predicted transport protein
MYSIISQNSEIEQEFRKYLNNKEIYKFLNDIIEDSQNILLILDGEKIELPEIIETYTDTWGKIVKIQIIKKFVNGDSNLYVVNPEFENIDLIDTFAESTETENVQSNKITEEYHLENIEPDILKIYSEIKNKILEYNNKIYFNPQKYYISIRLNHNLAFFKIRKKKLRLIVMLPENIIKGKIKNYNIKSLTESVQKFYNGPCAAIDIDIIKNIDEISEILKIVIENDTNDA